MSEDKVIFFAEVNSSQADNKSAVQAAISPSPFVVPEENVAGERGEESPVGGPEGPIEVGGVCELRRKRLGKNVSEGVVDTALLPQCEFSNLPQLPLALLLEFLCWPVNEFYWAIYAARAGTWRWLREAIMF